MFTLAITNGLTASGHIARTTTSPQVRHHRISSSSMSSTRPAFPPRPWAAAASEGDVTSDMSRSGKSSSNEDKVTHSMADDNIIQDQGAGTVAGSMSGSGKSSSDEDKISNLADAHMVNQQGESASSSCVTASDMPPSAVGNSEPGFKPQKSMTGKGVAGNETPGSASAAKSRVSRDLMAGDDSEMMGRVEEVMEARHKDMGSGSRDAGEAGNIPLVYEGDEARQQESQMSADI